MLKGKTLNRILLLLFFFSLCACEKEEPSPSGSNSLSWKVNGKSFRAENNDWKKSAASAGITNDTLGVGGSYSIDGQYESAGFRIENFSGPGTYILNSSEGNTGRYHGSSTVHAHTDGSHMGEVVVTHHLPGKGIIAGTFTFTAIDPHTGITYKITDGKFDMSYSYTYTKE